MLDLRAVTKAVLRQVETLSGKPVEIVADEELCAMATMQIAPPCHLLRYRPGGGLLDYLVVHQAGFLLRPFADEPPRRFDLVAEPRVSLAAESMVTAGREPNDDDRSLLPGFAEAGGLPRSPHPQLVIGLTLAHFDDRIHRLEHLAEARVPVILGIEGGVQTLDHRPHACLVDPRLPLRLGKQVKRAT
jgi:hypothetical protein